MANNLPSFLDIFQKYKSVINTFIKAYEGLPRKSKGNLLEIKYLRIEVPELGPLVWQFIIPWKYYTSMVIQRTTIGLIDCFASCLVFRS